MKELVASAGLSMPSDIRPYHIMRRVNGPNIQSYAELYPGIECNCLKDNGHVPEIWQKDWQQADPEKWN